LRFKKISLDYKAAIQSNYENLTTTLGWK